MKFININQYNSYIFEGFDPLFMLAYLSADDNYAIGALLTDENGHDYPTGLMVFKLQDDSIIILWLYVGSEYRKQGIGDALLDKVLGLAKISACSRLQAYFSNSVSYNLLCPMAERYFSEHGFMHKVRLYGEWNTDIRSLLDKSYFDGYVPKEKVYSLSKLTNIKRNFIDCDRDISFIISKGKSSSVIMANEIKGVLFLVHFIAEDEETGKELLFLFLNAAKEKYNGRTLVRVLATTKLFGNIMSKICENDRHDNFVLTANLAELNRSKFSAPLDDMSAVAEDYELSNYTDIDKYLYSGKDLIVELSEIRKSQILANTVIPSGVESFGNLNLYELNKLVIDAKYDETTGVMKSLPKDLSWFDTDVSCFMKKEGKVICIFVAAVLKDGSLRPVILFSKGKENSKYLIGLLQYANKKALEKFPENTKVLFRMHNTNSEIFYKKVLGIQ